MSIKLNHTIVNVRDKRASADFLTGLFGLPPAKPFIHFLCVQIGDTTLDFCNADYAPEPQHYAFLVSEKEFDAIFGRIQKKGIGYWADPMKKGEGQDQPSRRRPRRLLRGAGRALPRDHHQAVRRLVP